MAQGTLDADITAEHPLVVAARDIEKAINAARDPLTFVTDPAVLGDAVLALVRSTGALDGLRAELVTQARTNGVPQSVGVLNTGL